MIELDDAMMDKLADGARDVVTKVARAYLDAPEHADLPGSQALFLTAAGVITAAAELLGMVNMLEPGKEEVLFDGMVEQFREAFATANASWSGTPS